MVVFNKSDVIRMDELPPEKRDVLKPLLDDDITTKEMSTVTDEGVMDVKIEVKFLSISSCPIAGRWTEALFLFL